MKLLSTTFKTLIAPTVLALSIGAHSTSYAADAKEYPGAGCLPATTSQSNVSYDRLNNRFKANGNITAVCPVVRDKATNTNGINYAYVRIHRKSGNPSPLCSFVNNNKFGAGQKFQNYSSFPTGNSFRKFKINSSYNRGSYRFACNLRSGDIIYSYKVSEF